MAARPPAPKSKVAAQLAVSSKAASNIPSLVCQIFSLIPDLLFITDFFPLMPPFSACVNYFGGAWKSYFPAEKRRKKRKTRQNEKGHSACALQVIGAQGLPGRRAHPARHLLTAMALLPAGRNRNRAARGNGGIEGPWRCRWPGLARSAAGKTWSSAP